MDALTGLNIEQLKTGSKVTDDARKEFLAWLAFAISSTESKYKALGKQEPLDLVFSFYRERVRCYNAMLHIDLQHPGFVLGVNDILAIPNHWQNPTLDFWLAMANCFDHVLTNMDTNYLVRRYAAIENPKSILRLALAKFWVNELLDEIDRRANLQKIGKEVWRSGIVGAFYKHKWGLVPKTRYKVAGETDDDRFNRAFNGFEKYVRKEETRAGMQVTDNQAKRMASVMARSLPSDWHKTANLFIQNDLKACVATLYPIIGGKLEFAYYDILSRFRDYYERNGEIRYHTTGEKVSARVIYPKRGETTSDMLARLTGGTVNNKKWQDDTLLAAGLRYNPERILIKKQEHMLREKAIQLCHEKDPEFYTAHVRHGQNLSKIALELGISRPTLYARIKQIKEAIATSLRIPLDEFPLEISSS